MPREPITRVSAITTIGALIGWALYLGYNGLMLATGLAAIAGIAGYAIGQNQAEKAKNAFSGGDAT